MTELSPVQLDLVHELVDLGCGRASTALGEMTGQQVLLSVASLELLPRERVRQKLADENVDLTGVSERFRGSVNGEALLVFPEAESLELMRALLASHPPLEQMTELEQESLVELGNVILSACLGAFADGLGVEILSDLPDCKRGTARDIVGDRDSHDSATALSLSIDFALLERRFAGYVVFLLDVDGLSVLIRHIDESLAKSTD